MDFIGRLRHHQDGLKNIDLYNTRDQLLLLELMDRLTETCNDIKKHCANASQKQVLNYCLIKTEYAKQLTQEGNAEYGKDLANSTLHFLIKECGHWGMPQDSH